MQTGTLDKFLKIFIIHVFKFSDESLSSIRDQHGNVNIIQFFSNFGVVSHGIEISYFSNNSLTLHILPTNFFSDIIKGLLNSFFVASNNADVESHFAQLDAEFLTHAAVSSSYHYIRVLLSVSFVVVECFAQIVTVVVWKSIFDIASHFRYAIQGC